MSKRNAKVAAGSAVLRGMPILRRIFERRYDHFPTTVARTVICRIFRIGEESHPSTTCATASRCVELAALAPRPDRGDQKKIQQEVL
jgi:hypothetical protein